MARPKAKTARRWEVTQDDLESQLRAALAGDGRSMYALEKASGVQANTLSKFLDGLVSLSLKGAAALATTLGYRLVKHGSGRGRTRK